MLRPSRSSALALVVSSTQTLDSPVIFFKNKLKHKMATTGPDLPPHLLAKRKRQQESDEETRVPSPQPQRLPSTPSPSSSNNDDTKRRR
ncbi:MAG: hypothetical protein Q9174_007236, partial [Haloplaca sp. 1 TL-2023]